MNKICVCKEDNAFFNDFGIIKCGYCVGRITNKKRLKAIEEYNTQKK